MTDKATAADAPDATKAVAPRKLPESRFRLAEHVRNIYSVTPEEGTPFAALLDPAYWAHNARRMRIGDRIEVCPDDESYFAELRVMSIGPAGARVAVLFEKKIEVKEISADLATDYKVEWKGPHHKYAVIRISTKESVHTGSATREDAVAWMGLNAKALAVPAKAA